MNNPVVVFDRVSKSYPRYVHITGGLKNFLLRFPKEYKSLKASRYEAFRDVSFTVHKGEGLGIIGRNGA
ncbi:MAG: sugar ABC transporter ATP-binding protein, partial [Pseudomonadota bacterium]|nr:sugar ABC transporter ATP-binding protein [Pseudomonadota bacterium]